MFQEKERMEYYSQKAPDELKNRTWMSIQQEKKKLEPKNRQVLSLAACFAGIILFSNVMLQNSTIVKVNDMPVSYWNVDAGHQSGDIPFTISEGRNKEIRDEIQMEINVSENAQIEVSAGTIHTEVDGDVSQQKNTKLDIQGETVVCWDMEGDDNTIATCTIKTGNEVYQYVLELTETGWKLRLKEKN